MQRYLNDVVQVVVTISVSLWTGQVDLSQPRGVGEKRILREVAVLLNCPSAGAAHKQAIQFGSRVAKVTGLPGEQASDVCRRLDKLADKWFEYLFFKWIGFIAIMYNEMVIMS